MSFAERAEGMGLIVQGNGVYDHYDRYSQVRYRELATTPNYSEDDGPEDETAGYGPGLMAVFTRPNPPSEVDTIPQWEYTGYVSRIYKFVSNEQLVDSIRESIENVGLPVINEHPIMSFKQTQLRSELVIQSQVSSPREGDAYPLIVVRNSYDGSWAQNMQFGLSLQYSGNRLAFAFSLGEMRQIHVAGATTTLTTTAQDYVNTFSSSLLEMIESSFNSRMTEEQVMATLDIVRELGKRRGDEISRILSEMTTEGELPSAWQVFLAIVRYSSFEENLNMKVMLESIAESVLVIPSQMLEVLQRVRN